MSLEEFCAGKEKKLSEYHNDELYGRDDFARCDKCGSKDSEEWHEFTTRDGSVERILCDVCFAEGMPRKPAPPRDIESMHTYYTGLHVGLTVALEMAENEAVTRDAMVAELIDWLDDNKKSRDALLQNE